jgi:hypothetical protein
MSCQTLTLSLRQLISILLLSAEVTLLLQVYQILFFLRRARVPSAWDMVNCAH